MRMNTRSMFETGLLREDESLWAHNDRNLRLNRGMKLLARDASDWLGGPYTALSYLSTADINGNSLRVCV